MRGGAHTRMDRGFELTAAAPHSLQWCHVGPLHHTHCSGAMWDHCTTLPAVVPCGTTAPHSLQWCHVGPLHHTPCSGAMWDPLHHTPCSGAMWDHCTTLPAVVPCGTTAPHSLQWCQVGPLHHTHCTPVSKPSLVSSQACSVRLSHVTHKSAPVCCHGNT